MRAIETIVTVHEDGSAAIEQPLPLPVGDHRIVVVIDDAPTTARDANGWPVGFFDATYGSLADDPLARPEQDNVQEREPIR